MAYMNPLSGKVPPDIKPIINDKAPVTSADENANDPKNKKEFFCILEWFVRVSGRVLAK